MLINRTATIFFSSLLLLSCSEHDDNTSVATLTNCEPFMTDMRDKPDTPAELQDRISRQIKSADPDLIRQWLCLKNGSLDTVNPDYLRLTENTEYTRNYPHLSQLRSWSKALYQALQSQPEKTQQTLLETFSSHIPEHLIEEKKSFDQLLKAFKQNRLSLENLIVGYSLTDIHESQLDSYFKITK